MVRVGIAGIHVSFIGAVGIPNCYGGFEAFLEHCAPEFAKCCASTVVTCYSRAYSDMSPSYKGVGRRFLKIPANGVWSVFHDLVAFFMVFPRSTHIIVLGVSGGPWFPLFRVLCSLFGKKLIVNIDGVEWKRAKFSGWRQSLLRLFDALAQMSAHRVVYDNAALLSVVLRPFRRKSVLIPYSGDHVLRLEGLTARCGTALTVCRIEPENNIEMLIEGAIRAGLSCYTIVGNWGNSEYGRLLREKYADYSNLTLLDSVYDPVRLATLRETCGVYIHGHSVGGTNPSLVEMLFYDCRILCFEVQFHHETAGECAEYFSTAHELGLLLAKEAVKVLDRGAIRLRYSREAIVRGYLRELC